MVDPKLLRDHPEVIREALKKRGIDPEKLQLGLDAPHTNPTTFEALVQGERNRRAKIVDFDNVRRQLKEQSESFGREKAAGKRTAPPTELKELSDQAARLEQQVKTEEAEFSKLVSWLPNIPHESVPVGDATKNGIGQPIGEQPTFSFTPKTHMELAEQLGLIDFARAAKITGSHFPLFTGQGARLERALINWMLDVHTKEHGYTEVSPPFLVNRSSMFGTGQLPKFKEDMYHLKDDDLFLVPTAEVPVTNLHRDEILEEGRLPLRYTAYTPCFRREAGSYGKETKGLIRVHQFDKVELVKFTTPETSYGELDQLVKNAETILQRLGLHYRVVCLSTGELGFAAAKCYDLEAWAPGLNQFLEVSSCSNFEAFQSRRANIRYRQASTKKVAHVHTLNGSGVALARTLICLLETYQQADGRVGVPEPLRPYLDGQTHL
ncbi:MAG: serine--tRNA ligase [Candidatus Omnitrophota bacterium]|nr:serine--tRNA ligase [Candidatus Omnitrophota bacterium]